MIWNWEINVLLNRIELDWKPENPRKSILYWEIYLVVSLVWHRSSATCYQTLYIFVKTPGA